jgi:TrwC relaxase
VTGSFEQLISLTGGPQIHVHNLVLDLVQAERTGEWGRLDSRGLDQHRGGAAALGCRQMESALTRELGVCWIAGISQATIDLFSSYPDDEYKRLDDLASPDSERQEPPTAEPSESLSLRDEMKKWAGSENTRRCRGLPRRLRTGAGWPGSAA